MPFRSIRPLARGTLAAAIGLGLLTGCGSGSSPSPTPNANDLIAAGLRAQESGHVDEATRDYNQVLQLDPQNKYAYYNLGLIAQTANPSRPQEAEKDYRLALIIDPNFEQALFNLATVREKINVWESIELYYHVIQDNPSYAEAHFNLGHALLDTGQIQQGNAEIATGLKLKPSLGTTTPAASPSPTP